MARLPDIAEAPVQGTPTLGGELPATDLGLGNLAQTASEVHAANVEADKAEAAQRVLTLQGANETGFQQEAAAVTPDNAAGFAARQIAKAQGRAQTLLADPSLTPGVKLQLGMMANQETARIGQQAIAHESTLRAKPIADMTAAIWQSRINNVVIPAENAFQTQRQALIDNDDGSTPGLTGRVSDLYAQTAAEATAAAPDDLKGAVQAHFAAGHLAQTAEVGAIEEKHAASFAYNSALTQANGVVNSVSSSPLAYDNAVNNLLPQIVAAMPGGITKAMRHDILTGLQGEAASARIKGLVDQGDAAQAQQELNAGRYDAVLKPDARQALADHVDAALRFTGPKTFDQWMSAQDVERRAQAETYARQTTGKSTGQVNLDEIVAKLSPAKAAEFASQWQAADKAYAAAGSMRDMPTADVQAALAAPPPDPAAPGYADAIVAYQNRQQAAAAELKARQNPGAWAFDSQPGAAKAKTGAGVAQDRGAALQSAWQAFTTAPDAPTRAQAGQSLASQSLGVQRAAGIAPGALQLVPQAQAAALAASVVSAPPEGRVAALQGVAGLLHALPASVTLADGSTVAPQAILGRQLLAAHMTPLELSAIADYGADPAKLGRVVAALNDTSLAKGQTPGQISQVTAQARAALQPYLQSVAPLPGAEALAQARIDRTALVARELMASQHLSAQDAVKVAAGDLTGAYQYTDGYRIPLPVAAAAPGFLGFGSATSQIRAGAAGTLSALLSHDGANLYAPSTNPGDPALQRKLYAAQLQHSGRWVTNADDGGLTLMAPHADGGWDPVADKWGRAVTATWSQLQGGGPPAFATPPSNTPRGPDGTPAPAVSRGAALQALGWAVNGQESNFANGRVSPKGALGQMQVMPETAKPYALRLFGQPLDEARLQNDPAYNRAIGNAVLSDQVAKYGSGAGIGLALAAYNAGPGRLDGYTDAKGYHPGWLQTIGDPRTGKISLTDFVARIPFPETRAYVQSVLPHALARLQGGR